MPVLPYTEQAIEAAAAIIRSDGLVAFPTETVYGLGGSALSEAAIEKIYSVKGRPVDNPLIIHVADYGDIFPLVDHPADSKEIARLTKLKVFWPGPLTVVLNRAASVPKAVSGSEKTVALRIPNHPCALSLIRAAETPIAAPSANPSGYISPTSAPHVNESLGDKIDLILDGGPCTVGIESTVISIIGKQPAILRPGGITHDEIERALKEKVLFNPQTGGPKLSPGLSRKHYSPRTPFKFIDQIDLDKLSRRRVGLLSFSDYLPPGIKLIAHIRLNEKNQAGNLYAAMRDLDALNLDLILVERPKGDGITAAIIDRLSRATAD